MMELTKYEFARIIGARALQLSLGAPSVTKNKKTADPIEMAKEEYDAELIPLSVLR
ncbi:MAG: DNA-directed RNA polymerase subunit K [Candidatus Micrarchaeia archaeon]